MESPGQATCSLRASKPRRMKKIDLVNCFVREISVSYVSRERRVSTLHLVRKGRLSELITEAESVKF